LLGAISFALFGVRRGSRSPIPPESRCDAAPLPAVTLTWRRALTAAGIGALAAGALLVDLDLGFSAFVIAVLLSALDPVGAKGAIGQIAWSTVLLVCGIVTYVSLMEDLGTMDYLGTEIAAIGAALAAALAICYFAGVVSAFASTTGIIGALIPLAVPLLDSKTSPRSGSLRLSRSQHPSSTRARSRRTARWS
jgi:di/tricarboxylate transporter